MSQVVIGAAGYDGRAFRYAKPGVSWFELDHPSTQADKLAGLAHLGVQSGHVRFVAADFASDPVAERLLDAGLDPKSPSLFLLEGVAVYLELGVLADCSTSSGDGRRGQPVSNQRVLRFALTPWPGQGSRPQWRRWENRRARRWSRTRRPT